MTNQAFEDLKDDFEFIDDWEERYKYVIELGKQMPELPESEHNDQNKVNGCVSQVWLKSYTAPGQDGKMHLFFIGDSDALIVRGLVAVLRILLNDRPVTEVAKIDASKAIADLGLHEHLTPQRANGLTSMIKRLQADAASVT